MNSKFINITKEHKTEFEFFRKKLFPVAMYWEGGGKLHNIKGDSGGWTIWGIAYNKNKHHFKNLEEFKRTTEEEAAAFAFVQYYLPLKPQFLPCNTTKLYMFDMSYNMGTFKAITIMQKCLGLVEDGIIGPKTTTAMSKVKVSCLHTLRTQFYYNLARKPSLAKFLKGWLNRANDIYKRTL